ncbi:MAG: O-antigen ligase family protein [Acidobacteria bacterium]|nr:O-antigen ligase family protein [Acidobacteriota bacterium]
MSRAAVIAASVPGGGSSSAVPLAAIAGVAVATALAAVVSNGSLVASVAPLLVAALVWAVAVAPLRTTLGVVMFLGLAADRPGDTEGFWASPVQAVGGLLFHNLNHAVGIESLKFSGVFALLGLLLAVRAYRRLTGRVQDTPDSLTLAAPMRWALGLALATVAALVAFGAARGGDIQMAKVQVQGFLQLLAVAYLFGVSLRGTRDYRWLGGVIVAAASVKAAMALWVRATLPAMVPDRWGAMRELEYATNHGDSLLFACAAAVLVGPLFHRPTRHQIVRFALLMPVVVAGLVANDRRIAWVQLGLVAIAFLLMNPASALTRRVARGLVLMSPLLLAYTVVGWSSPSRVFAPVGFVRSIVQPERTDGSLDRSTLFRDVENFNLVNTFRSNPVVGTGFGHPFVVTVEGDALPDFVEYGFLPHNSMLGLWAFTGFIGFSGIFGALVVAALLAVRARARAPTSEHAIAAVAVVGCLGAYVVHLWADIGFTEAPTIFLVGLAMAMAGQLAVATGDWPLPTGRRPVRMMTTSVPTGAVG